MARTIEAIMQQLLTVKEQDVTLRKRLTSTSKTAIWRLLLYVCAVCAHSVEVLMDAFKGDVRETVARMRPHTVRWYQEMARLFMKDKTLPEGSDTYDTTGMTDEQIEEARVVKYAAVVEQDGEVIVKAAKGDEGARLPLDSDELTALQGYMDEVKDAGVRLLCISGVGERFACALTVFYDPAMTAETVAAAVRAAIKGYVTSLPFNGLYTNMALVDAVQAVDGVKIAELTAATADGAPLTVCAVPQYGYYNISDEDITVNTQPYA